jgi:hypothetical protein
MSTTKRAYKKESKNDNRRLDCYPKVERCSMNSIEFLSLINNAEKKIVIKSEDEHLIFGEVYRPGSIDTDEEAMTAEEIKKAAYAFMQKGFVHKIDTEHNLKENGSYVVENFLARKNDPDGFAEGAWVIGVKVPDEDTWGKVKKGELNGFSFYGNAKKVTATVQIEAITEAVGKTEGSNVSPFVDHTHDFIVKFDENNKVISTETGYTFCHCHRIEKTTATEDAENHAHRIVIFPTQ